MSDDDAAPFNETGAEMIQAMLMLNTMLEPIFEAAVAYKGKALHAGFTEVDASSMATEYHNMLMTAIAKQQGTGVG